MYRNFHTKGREESCGTYKTTNFSKFTSVQATVKGWNEKFLEAMNRGGHLSISLALEMNLAQWCMMDDLEEGGETSQNVTDGKHILSLTGNRDQGKTYEVARTVEKRSYFIIVASGLYLA